MKPSRTQRLDSEYRRAVAEVISGALKDKEPELRGIISVTEAQVAPDLKTAKIYVSVYASTEEEKEKSFSVLRANAGFVRRELAAVMRTRTVPQISFFEDGSMEYGSRMDALFKELERNEEK